MFGMPILFPHHSIEFYVQKVEFRKLFAPLTPKNRQIQRFLASIHRAEAGVFMRLKATDKIYCEFLASKFCPPFVYAQLLPLMLLPPVAALTLDYLYEQRHSDVLGYCFARVNTGDVELREFSCRSMVEFREFSCLTESWAVRGRVKFYH